MRRFVLAAATLVSSFVLAGPATAADQPAAGQFTLAPAALQPVLVGTISAQPLPGKGEQPLPALRKASSIDVL
jgi:hypothetical protein